jgi:hypothetical protein
MTDQRIEVTFWADASQFVETMHRVNESVRKEFGVPGSILGHGPSYTFHAYRLHDSRRRRMATQMRRVARRAERKHHG